MDNIFYNTNSLALPGSEVEVGCEVCEAGVEVAGDQLWVGGALVGLRGVAVGGAARVVAALRLQDVAEEAGAHF